jgi:indole-3-glycerol phosphate synthase
VTEAAVDLLEQILRERITDAERAEREAPLARPSPARMPGRFATALARTPGPALIAEMKRASPSAGMLATAYDPVALAAEYERAGAAALSVLTEPRHFLGDGEHLRRARAASRLPILRKDFTGHPRHVREAALWGANAVLLIVAALPDAELRALHDEAAACGLDTLAEAHTAAELERALALDGALVGVNSRDLKTLRTDLDVARRLAAVIPPGRLAVAESGIRGRGEIAELHALGYRGFLVGEALLRHPGGPAAKIRELLGTAAP